MPAFSPLVDRIAGGGADAWIVHYKAMGERAAGREITFLTIGDPDQDAPAAVIEAACQALRDNKKGYSPIAGMPAARQAVAARMSARTGRPCAEGNIILTAGAQAAMYGAIQCIAGPGEEVIAPEPVYATYPAVIGAASATMVNVPLDPDRGFHPDIATIAAAITPKTRAIWINSPHNPTGALLDRAEMTAIAELCRRHDLWFLSDEVYADLCFARPHTSAWSLPEAEGRAIVVTSLSKSHAIPGFRFGWTVAPEALIGHLTNLSMCKMFGGPPFVQEAVLPALQGELPEAIALSEAYRRRAIEFTAILSAAPNCRIAPPEGGMFALLDVRGTGLTALAFAEGLLEQEAVAVLACDAFGASVAGHLRIALTLPDKQLLAAGRKIVAYATRLATRG